MMNIMNLSKMKAERVGTSKTTRIRGKAKELAKHLIWIKV